MPLWTISVLPQSGQAVGTEQSELERTLDALEPDTLSPREALDVLYSLKALIRQ